jgi:hypothetical protein
MRPALLEFLDYREKMAHRARQAVEPDDDQDIADANLVHQAGENRPGPRGAGSMLLVQDLAACRSELVDLSVRRLLLGRDAGIADQASDRSERGGVSCGHGLSGGDSVTFVQYRQIGKKDPLQACFIDRLRGS